MLLTSALLLCGGGYLVGIAIDATRSVSGARAEDVIEGFVDERLDSAADAEAGDADLRDDLFTVPTAPKRVEREEPRTHPVDLLALIELQGIMGGKRPRAMVHFRKSQETVTVSVGDDLGEFEVVDIRERSVVLRWRDELFELSL